jgi:hypothetical protein
MNVRILRMCQRFTIGGNGRQVHGLGQLQPVQFGFTRDGTLRLSIEGLSGDQWCWWRLPLPRFKAQARKAFAELETCRRNKTETPAAKAWREYNKARSN